MPKFLFIYRSDNDAHYKMTPDEMQQNHRRWVQWFEDGIKQGWIVDTGDGLQAEGRVVNSKQVVTDGPFAESKEVVGGFSIVQAGSLDDAAALAKGSPCLLVGGSVEVRPLFGFTMDR